MTRHDAVRKLLKRCNDAFALLRDTSRMFFMWELLELRESLLECRIAEIDSVCAMDEKIGTKEYRERGRLEKWQRENAQWKWVLDAVYTDFGVPKETWEYSYLYVKKGVNCYSDVIRIRRKMFGMTAKELYDGICGEAVLRRMEQRISKPHRFNVRQFFARLGLSMELMRTELVSGDPEVKKLIEMLNRDINNLRWERAEELLFEIEKRALVEEKVNQQALMQKMLLLQWSRGEIENEEFVDRMKATLELTLPWGSFLSEGKNYLTDKEQTCIQNMMMAMDKESEEFEICMKRLKEYYDDVVENELQDATSSMFEYIAGYVGSELGNKGYYEVSDKYNQCIIEGCLRFRRMMSLPNGLYGCWWNHAKRLERDIPVSKSLDGVAELSKCILLSKLDRQEQRTPFYEEVMKKLLTDNG